MNGHRERPILRGAFSAMALASALFPMTARAQSAPTIEIASLSSQVSKLSLGLQAAIGVPYNRTDSYDNFLPQESFLKPVTPVDEVAEPAAVVASEENNPNGITVTVRRPVTPIAAYDLTVFNSALANPESRKLIGYEPFELRDPRTDAGKIRFVKFDTGKFDEKTSAYVQMGGGGDEAVSVLFGVRKKIGRGGKKLGSKRD